MEVIVPNNMEVGYPHNSHCSFPSPPHLFHLIYPSISL